MPDPWKASPTACRRSWPAAVGAAQLLEERVRAFDGDEGPADTAQVHRGCESGWPSSSGSLGLGHVTRDLAIASRLRRRLPGAEISWLAAHPATAMLERARETVLPEAAELANENVFAEQIATGNGLSVFCDCSAHSPAGRRIACSHGKVFVYQNGAES